MSKPVRREFVLSAGTFNADKHEPEGMFMSEKLDGNRCWWDGGVSRGKPTVDVPWANIYDDDGCTLKKKIKPVASGLWSRYGNPTIAPEWFLDALPVGQPLDGELYAGHGKFQYVQKAVRRDEVDEERWEGLRFAAFGCPTYNQMFENGLIKLSGNVVFHRQIVKPTCLDYVHAAGAMDPQILGVLPSREFWEELDALQEIVVENNNPLLYSVKQTVVETMDQVMRKAQEVSDAGGEGVMLRVWDSVWYPKRKQFILKVKPRHDSEATIVGFYAGKRGKTDLLYGKMGGIIVRWHGDVNAECGLLKKGVDFEIGTGFGLLNGDRDLYPGDQVEARENPGKPLSTDHTNKFKFGDKVTFSYRELSDDGVPKEGAFLRLYEAE